jgi:3-hydroxyacyl-CoA dehydrogenase
VRGSQTEPDVIATALAVAKRLNKVGVVAGNCPGFLGNRMMFPYMYEAQFLVEEGATPLEVDRALTEFGMAMGVFAVIDLAGIDVWWRIRQELKHFSDPGARKPLVEDILYEMGRYGQKTNQGWYRYGADRKAEEDPSVTELIRTARAKAGIEPRSISTTEILERCLYALINEGAKALGDGSALRASDLDVLYVNGYGFPAWRGGPMFYADTIGLKAVYETIRRFEAELGSRWEPAPLLERLAREGGSFREMVQ